MRVFLFSLLVLSSLPALSQENEIDSLSQIINTCLPLDGDSCQTVIQELIKSVENSSNQRLYAHILIYAGEAYSDIGDFDKGERLLIKAKTISESIGATALNANSTDLLGIIALGQGNYQEAISYFVSSAKICEELGDKAELANVYLQFCYRFF